MDILFLLYLGMGNAVYLDGQKLECYYKRNGKFFYRDPITKQKLFAQKQESVGVYNFDFNVPHVIDKTIEFKSYSANPT